MSLDIVEIGLVYGVKVVGRAVNVLITMTSPACPVTEYIAEEATHEVQRALGTGFHAMVAVTWEPPWEPERMSERARSAMGWD
jgi:metal-sulfur cluster biosynthetic enzyme